VNDAKRDALGRVDHIMRAAEAGFEAAAAGDDETAHLWLASAYRHAKVLHLYLTTDVVVVGHYPMEVRLWMLREVLSTISTTIPTSRALSLRAAYMARHGWVSEAIGKSDIHPLPLRTARAADTAA
jgi:hypothetical protein